ncbi:hypothetical protein AHF37_05825 [Paragonimus kellicotti]|nr:hypothetical protein AHF37_05825 [Paragonimus kellicotti]
MSPNPHMRKGGLLGLASVAVALKQNAGLYFKSIIPSVLRTMHDNDARVRYYACETLYNVMKITRRETLSLLVKSLTLSVGASCVKNLIDKLFEKRKLATPEIERITKESFGSEKHGDIVKLLGYFSQDFLMSPNPHMRKGGLLGLASVAVALKQNAGLYFKSIIPSVLRTMHDNDARVRYYACETLYNVMKITRRETLSFLGEVFDAVSRGVADPDMNVRKGAIQCDRLLKEIVTEPDFVDLSIIVSLLRERIYTNNPHSRQFIVSWTTTLHAIPGLKISTYLPQLLDGLFRILGDPNPDIRRQCEILLTDLLNEIVANSKEIAFDAMINSLIVHCRLSATACVINEGLNRPPSPYKSPTTTEFNTGAVIMDTSTQSAFITQNPVGTTTSTQPNGLTTSGEQLQQRTALTWILAFVELDAEHMLPFAAGIIAAVLPCFSLYNATTEAMRTRRGKQSLFLFALPFFLILFYTYSLSCLATAVAILDLPYKYYRTAFHPFTHPLACVINEGLNRPPSPYKSPTTTEFNTGAVIMDTSTQSAFITQNPVGTTTSTQPNGLTTSGEQLQQRTALTWILAFVELDAEHMLPFAAGIIAAVLPCFSLYNATTEAMRTRRATLETAVRINETLLNYVSTFRLKDLPESSTIQSDRSAPETTSVQLEHPVGQNCPLRAAESVNGMPQTIDTLLDTTCRLLEHQALLTRLAALRWIEVLGQARPLEVLSHVARLLPLMLKLLDDPSTDVVHSVIRLFGCLCDHSDVIRLLDENTLTALNIPQELFDMLVTSPASRPSGGTRSLKGKTGGHLMSQSSLVNVDNNYYCNVFCVRFLLDLVWFFDKNTQLLAQRGDMIITDLCYVLTADVVYRVLSAILSHMTELRSSSVLVQALNRILLTQPALHEFRNRLRAIRTEDDCHLLERLYRAWCHNPVALLSLYMLTQNYQQANRLIKSLYPFILVYVHEQNCITCTLVNFLINNTFRIGTQQAVDSSVSLSCPCVR